MKHIRLQKSPQLEEVLLFFQDRYRLLSEPEIIKMVLSERFYAEKQQPKSKAKKLYKSLRKSGQKLGGKILAERGLKRKDLSEKELYNLIESPHV